MKANIFVNFKGMHVINKTNKRKLTNLKHLKSWLNKTICWQGTQLT